MPMKFTDLHRNRGLKIRNEMRAAGAPERFGDGAATPLDRRERRKLDQARGLTPFAVKLEAELIGEVRARAAQRGLDLNDAVADLLRKGLAAD